MTTRDGPRERPVDADVDLRVPAQRREIARRQWDVLAVIAAGGVIGAEARYGMSALLPHAADRWPWATLLTNASGCLLIGMLMVVITELVTPHRLLRPFLGVGLLGGYTTFSTYSVEMVQLLGSGKPGTALAYLVVSPLVALLAVWLGTLATRAAAWRRLRAVAG